MGKKQIGGLTKHHKKLCPDDDCNHAMAGHHPTKGHCLMKNCKGKCGKKK